MLGSNPASRVATELTLSVVFDGLVGLLLVELDGGEGPDLGVGQLVEGGVHLGHDDVVLVGQRLGQLLPNWHQLLAVAAPGGVEFNLKIIVNDKLGNQWSHGGDACARPPVRAGLARILGQT